MTATLAPPAPPILAQPLSPAPHAPHLPRRLASRPFFVWLDSAAADTPLGRYSFLTADPFVWLTARGRSVTQAGPGPVVVSFDGDPFATLARWLARYPLAALPGLPPFQG